MSGGIKKALKVVAIGALVVVGGPIVGQALVGGLVSSTAVATAIGSGVITGGITALQGGSPEDVLKSAVIGGVASGLGAQAAGSVQTSIAEAAKQAGYADVAGTMANVAAGVTQGAVSGASRSVLSGKGDPLESLIYGGISGGIAGGVSEGVNTLASDIPGFAKYDNATGKFTEQGDIPLAVQRATKAAMAAGALGQDPSVAAQNSVLQTVSKYAGDQIKDFSGELKTAYQKAQDADKAIKDNQTAQQKAIDDYQAKAKEVNDKYEDIQTRTKDFETAKSKWENYDQTIKDEGWAKLPSAVGGGWFNSKGASGSAPPSKDSYAETANAIAADVNAKIKDYNTYRPEADKELASIKDNLTTLQTDLKTLDQSAIDANKDLSAAVTTFQNGEAKNAAQLAQMVKDTEAAQVVAKNDLGIDLTEEQLARAIQSGDIKGETNKIVAETNQASIDAGYENYKDQTAAKENGFDDAQQWASYKDTSGIVDTGADVNQVALGGQGKTADVFEPTDGYDYGGDYSAGLPDSTDTTDYALSDSDMFPADYTGDTQDTQVADNTQVDTPAPEDTTVADVTDTADIPASDTAGPETFAVEDTLTPYSDTPDVDLTSIFGDTTADVTAQDTPEVPSDLQAQLDELGLDIKDLGVDNIAAMTQGPKVTEAMVAPEGGSYDLTSSQRMSDIGPSTPDAGLASLVSQQQGGTSASADDTGGLKTITEENLGAPQTAGGDYGSAAYNALTGADTSRTITGNVLGQDRGDVLGGVESEGTYSGKESEITPSDTLTNKYFSEAPQTGTLAESITTAADERKAKEEAPTQSATDAVLQAGATPQDESSFLPKVSAEEATLFKSKDATPTEAVTEGKKMEDEYNWDQFDQATNDYMSARDQANAGGGDYDWSQFDQATNDYMADRQQNGFMLDSTTRAYPNDDGTYRLVNLETGEESTASWDQMQKMSSGQGFGPGDSAGLRGDATYKRTFSPPGMGDKIANAITGQLSNPKLLTALGGAALGAMSAKQATGVTPKGLRSLQAGTGKSLVQTGAKGTGGKGSVRYFEKKATGGAIGKGGLGYLKSAHDGMADKINATIDNKRPAKLSGGEFVIPADVVSHLGNGNSEAGAKQLYDLMDRIRKARTGTSEQGKQINPKKYLPK